MKPYLEDLGIQSYVRRDAAAAVGSVCVPVPTAALSLDAPSIVDPDPIADPTADVALMDWEPLRQAVLTCRRCGLHKSRTQGVFGVGDPKADWLVVGEAPGADEDRQGEPFVGRAGQLLDAMLKGLGLARGENVYIANVLKSRPPGNRDPSPEEVVACMPYLLRQIALIKPRIILAVGRIAAQNLLKTDTPIGKMRGKVYRHEPTGVPMVVTYHPAYLLRAPAEKRKAWADLKLAREVLHGSRQP